MDADHYTIDPGMSRFTVRAFASGVFSAFGHNPTIAIRDFSGEADFDPATLENAASWLVAEGAITPGDAAPTERHQVPAEWRDGQAAELVRHIDRYRPPAAAAAAAAAAAGGESGTVS